MLKEGLGKGMILTKLRLALIVLLSSLLLLTISGETFAQPPMHRIIIVFSKTPTFTQQEGPRAAKEIRGFGGLGGRLNASIVSFRQCLLMFQGGLWAESRGCLE